MWIIIGAVLGGAVQDFVILFASMRRDGKSLGQMAREEIGKVGGFVALITVLLIMVILLAVVALVVVNALKGSPWGTFTIAATMPIALFMGLYLRYWRPGKVLECSAIGFVLVMASIFGGQWVSQSATLAPWFTLERDGAGDRHHRLRIPGQRAAGVAAACAARLSEHLREAGRGAAAGVWASSLSGPNCSCRRSRGSWMAPGPIFAGKIFPFCFITIACGAISGFHALISSGTTPKMIAKESHALPVGYGSMLLESFVAIMAMVAACVLQPGVYFAVNSPAGVVGATPAAAVATISALGLSGDRPRRWRRWRRTWARRRCSTAPAARRRWRWAWRTSSRRAAAGGRCIGFWYHFAIMFEALFILTIIDAGTRVGRFMLQDLLRHVSEAAGPHQLDARRDR